MSVLGAILIEPNSLYKINDVLSPTDFYSGAHAIIYGAILELFNESKRVDLVILHNHLEARNQIEAVGGATYLATLTNAVTTASGVEHYAEIVKEKSIRRRLLEAHRKNEELILNEEANIDSVIAETQNRVFEINTAKAIKDDAATIVKEIDAVQQLYAEKYEKKQKYLGFSCGIAKIDEIIDGMRDGHVWVVGAWTSTGKTQFALNIVHNVLEQGIPVSIISLEMSRVDTLARLIGIRHNLSSMRVLKGKNETETHNNVEEGKFFMAHSPLEVHTTYFELEKIKAMIRKDVYLRGVKLVVIDYVQNILSDKSMKEYEIMTRAATSLQSLARELNIIVYLVSQISNESQKGQGAGAGFKGTGALEAVADIAIKLKRDKTIEREEDEFVPLDITVTKNRHGLTGQVKDHYLWLKSGRIEHKPTFIYIPKTVTEKLK